MAATSEPRTLEEMHSRATLARRRAEAAARAHRLKKARALVERSHAAMERMRHTSAGRAVLARHFPDIPTHDDVRTYQGRRGEAGIVVGGPPCQATSVAAAVHGYRTGESLWPDMLRICLDVQPEWIVVEQPPGNAEWEANVAQDLAHSGWHSDRLEFEARDVGAPYERRRVLILACTCLSRLEVAWSAGPSEIERVARAAHSRGAWDPDQLAALRVDARSAGEMERSESRLRRERIEALGDSNPPEMAEVIAGCIRIASLQPKDTPDV